LEEDIMTNIGNWGLGEERRNGDKAGLDRFIRDKEVLLLFVLRQGLTMQPRPQTFHPPASVSRMLVYRGLLPCPH
jgi:hypothetical protein